MHELSHNWFLQSVTPLNGSDTWLYEGFGFWVPYLDILGGSIFVEKLQHSFHLHKGAYALWSNEEIFQAKEIQSPHQSGAMFLASINQYIKSNGKKSNASKGLNPILKIIMSEKKHQTMSTFDFKLLLEKYTNLDFTNLFEYYIALE